MLRTLLAAVAITGLLCSAATAETPTIAVKGNQRLGQDSIRAFFHADGGKALTDADLDAALKAMYRSGEFSNVAIRREGGIVDVDVRENPVITRVLFEGNRKLDDKKLLAVVQSKKDGPLSRPLVQEDVQRLLDVYHHAGRYNAEVRPNTITQQNGRVELVFEIKEGERAGIRQIVFTGNKVFATGTLKDVIKSGETNLLSFLLNNDLYDPEKVESDRNLLQRYYKTHGYADMSVTSAVTTYDPAKKSFVLTFNVDEGRQYRFGGVAIDTALPDVDQHSLRSLLLTRTGDTYDAAIVDKSVDAITRDFASHGRPFVDVTPELQRSADGGTIGITYRIEQAPPLYVERIEIHGNTTTQDVVIRREIELGEGDAYNRALAARSEARLKKLGYFKSVKLSKQPGSAPDRVVLDVAVEEQDTGNFWVSGGHSDQDGWLAEVSVSDRNLFGRGENGKISVTYGQYSKGFDIAFGEPYLFGQRVSLGLDAFGKQTDSSSYQSYNSMVYGASATFGTPISDTVGLSWIYSIKNQSVSLDPSRGIASLPVQDAAAAGPQWVSTVGSGITYDTLDSETNPTRGMKARVNNDVAGFGGDVRFLRNTDDMRYYHDLSGGVVGLAHAQTGYITPWGGKSLPLLDNFFGGPSLVRGFAPAGFGPRDLTPGTTNDNIGGNAFWATSYELQAPVPLLPQSFGLKAAVFADAGSVWSTGASKGSPALSSSLVGNSRTVRSSVGAGLVWNSILGPLRVDYAYPLTKAPYDVTQRVHFGYGGF